MVEEHTDMQLTVVNPLSLDILLTIAHMRFSVEPIRITISGSYSRMNVFNSLLTMLSASV
jgi:hypothetical protein